MDGFFRLAVNNVIKHGDTDVFPYPFETRAFFDRQQELLELLGEYHNHFETYLAQYSPQNISSLTPIGYAGFRWATQLDPIWNLYFLSCVLGCSDAIEAARIPKADETVFSYRYLPDSDSGDLFDRDYTWSRFIARSEQLSASSAFVVLCDISEFYLRLDHHRLENALQQLNLASDIPKRIERFLHHFSNTRSFGLPIGGPAARLLSELTLNQIDRLLMNEGIAFVRFADDFHLFAASKEEAYQSLIFLSEKLFANQGLLLQKSKTRIVTGSEFRATSPLQSLRGEREQSDTARALLQFAIRFDPYSPTAEEDYERLKAEIQRFDIIGLLKAEIAKSRVHPALTRKIVSAVRFLDWAAAGSVDARLS
ncbi:MAG: RNA-directed DNA polymerase [Bauldia sp.]